MDPHLQEDVPRVLVVDDEKVIRGILSDFLTMEGLLVHTAENGEVALAELQRRPYNLVISDLKMPRMGGLELLEQIEKLNLNVLTVIMTGFGTVETAIAAMKKGAYDYVLKPFKVEEVVHIVQRGLERQRLELENMRLKEALSLYKISEAIGQSLSLDHILELMVDLAADELKADSVTVLLEDEKGSGRFVERVRRGRQAHREIAVQPKVAELLRCYRGALPVLAHGSKAKAFFERPPEGSPVVSFCSVPFVVHDRVLGMLNAYSVSRGRKFSEGQRKMLSVLGNRAAVTIENASLYESLLESNRGLELANSKLEENFRQTIVGFVNALEESDRYTRGHSERVSVYAKVIAQGMNLSPHEIDRVVLSAKIHDIGKIGVPTEQLNKPDGLTPDETAIFRSHPEKGKRILEPVPFLRDLIPGAHCHHENYDGSGYPEGLQREQIPLLGRIISVADAFDAMTTDRPYRRAMPRPAALEELKRCAGSQFDPEVVEVFIREMAKRRPERSESAQMVLPIAAAGSA